MMSDILQERLAVIFAQSRDDAARLADIQRRIHKQSNDIHQVTVKVQKLTSLVSVISNLTNHTNV